MKRFSKELKIKSSNNNFNIKFGSVNIKDNHSIYIAGSTYIQPSCIKESYCDDVQSLQRTVKHLVKKAIIESSLFYNNFMFDLDIRTSGIQYNKKSFLSFEIHLINKKSFTKLNEIENEIQSFSNQIIKIFEESFYKNDFLNLKKKMK